MPTLQIEFTDDTLVMTEQGVQRLADLLERSVAPCLWAIKWKFQTVENGISFHKTHKSAKKFAELQLDSTPAGPARLVDVSDQIYSEVQQRGYCWTNLNDFDEALTYSEVECRH